MCYGHHFVWVTDWYVENFILSYDGANQAILHLQMHLMGWDVDIIHCCNDHLLDADYWSRLDCNLCGYNPSFCHYLRLVDSFRRTYPAPTKIPMNPLHMPYYQGLCIPNLSTLSDEPHNPVIAQDDYTNIDYAAASLLTNIVTSHELGSPLLYLISPSALDHLERATGHPLPHQHGSCIMRSFKHLHISLLTFRGLYTDLIQGTSCQQSNSKTYHFWLN